MNLQSLYKLEDIHDNPFQGRTEYTDIEVLGRSIATDDLKEFPRARMNGKGVQLQFGHRRREAFKWLKANWKKEGLPDRYEGYTVMPLFIDDLSDEAMFRSAVIENEHRKELNPIEQAEMMRVYRDQFGKNSDEIGALFGMNGATVRGLIRLTDLPKNIQAQVASGEITQGAARKLLTVQRMDKDEVQNIAATLKNNKYMDVDQMVANAFEENDNSVEMWSGWHGDTPLAGHDLWEISLPIHKFPTAFLPDLTVNEVAKSLKLELTDALREKITDIIANLSTDGNDRTDVTQSVVADMIKDSPKDADLIERIAHLMYPPSCGACDFHAKSSGDHYCALKACHTRKTKAWKENIERGICKKIGITMYDPKADGKDFATVDERSDWGKKLLTAKNKTDLRLVEKMSYQQTIEGVPSRYSVVVVGESLRTLRESAAKTVKKEKSHQERQRDWEEERRIRAARQDAIRAFLWNVAVPAFEPLFESVTSLAFLARMAHHWGHGSMPARKPDKKATKAETTRWYRRVVIYSFLDSECPTWNLADRRTAVAGLAKHLQGLATAYGGVKLPKTFLTTAEEADQAVAAAVKSVAVETKGKKK